MKKTILVLMTLLLVTLVFAEKVAELPTVLKPQRIAIDGDKLIVSQRQDYSVHVYSLTDYRMIAKFGKKGEGPGEVKRPPYVFPLKDSILLYNWGKLIWFSKTGKLQKELRMDNELLLTVRPLTSNYLACRDFFNPKDFSHVLKFYLLDNDAKNPKELYSGERDANSADSKGFRQFKMVNQYLASKTYGDKIIIGDSRKGFYFKVFDFKGNLLYTIDKKFEKVKIGSDFKDKLIADLKIVDRELWPMVKNVMHFYEYFPPFRTFFVSEGRIYATTYKEKDGKHEIIILDLKGNLLKRIFLPLKAWKVCRFNSMEEDLFTIQKGKLYELVDNEDKELYELHITDISNLLPK